MTQDTALVVREGGSALDVYGDGQDIKKLAERIRLCLPGGDKLQNHEALALAQLSVAYQLNPFNGEVWYIPGRGTQVGIKGLRKTAHRQANYWTYFTALTTEQRMENAVPDGAIAYCCELYRTDLILESAKVIKAMNEAGMPDAAHRYAYRPTIGIGYFNRGEASKMKADQAARKRAEADALKQAFDLPFASEVGNGSTVGYVDTEWAEVEATPAPAGPHVDLYGRRDLEDRPPTVGERVLQAEVVTVSRDGDRPGRKLLSPEEIRAAVRKKAGWNGHRLQAGEPITDKQIPTIAMLLARASLADDPDKERHTILGWLFGVDSSKALTKREAGAVIDWLTVKDTLDLNEYAAQECAAIIRQAQIDAGQLSLYPDDGELD